MEGDEVRLVIDQIDLGLPPYSFDEHVEDFERAAKMGRESLAQAVCVMLERVAYESPEGVSLAKLNRWIAAEKSRTVRLRIRVSRIRQGGADASREPPSPGTRSKIERLQTIETLMMPVVLDRITTARLFGRSVWWWDRYLTRGGRDLAKPKNQKIIGGRRYWKTAAVLRHIDGCV